jgi:hypothetical protein
LFKRQKNGKRRKDSVQEALLPSDKALFSGIGAMVDPEDQRESETLAQGHTAGK